MTNFCIECERYYFGFTDRLDYIFYKNGVNLKESKIFGLKPKYPSDHAGVVANLEVSNTSKLVSPGLDSHKPFPISFWLWVAIVIILLITWLSWRKSSRK